MHILLTLIVGLFVGVIANLLTPGRDPGGVVITMLLGISGAVVMSFIGRGLGFFQAGDSGPGVIASVIGAVILLAAYRVVSRRKLDSPR